ncbi:tetratricopeptide repeat protein [Aquincola tertiaricarbonis]|uniref:tetratricopeptide repeat protein n=1 Tax=Aquincola tertiaricarbonis TaxID=391953 RepID=UPI000614DC12|nr:tetratricopeptide repeat protein [Aquincola tertiaricarbonis]
MRRLRFIAVRAALPALLLAAAGTAAAAPWRPASDAELVESLPARRAPAGPALAADPTLAVHEAGAFMAQAHAEGDPRFAGRALALLQPWAADAQAPAPVVLALASAEQSIHRFDSAQARLQALLARDARQPQAWLTLATLHRLRGRYADSDAACTALQQQAVARLHAQACLAENQALRGDATAARQQLLGLLPQTRDAGTRGWLLTTLGELEQRAGRPQPAEQALRAALQADPQDRYAALALADLLIDAARPQEALRLLDGQPRSNPVLLRRVAAGGGPADAAELRQRYEQAAQRPGGQDGHLRELALYAWWVQRDLPAAVRHAQANLATQREPFDLLLLARVATAAQDAAALQQARQTTQAMGLHDQRLQALLHAQP